MYEIIVETHINQFGHHPTNKAASDDLEEAFWIVKHWWEKHAIHNHEDARATIKDSKTGEILLQKTNSSKFGLIQFIKGRKR